MVRVVVISVILKRSFCFVEHLHGVTEINKLALFGNGVIRVFGFCKSRFSSVRFHERFVLFCFLISFNITISFIVSGSCFKIRDYTVLCLVPEYLKKN